MVQILNTIQNNIKMYKVLPTITDNYNMYEQNWKNRKNEKSIYCRVTYIVLCIINYNVVSLYTHEDQ